MLQWHDDSKTWKHLYWTAEGTMEIAKKTPNTAHCTEEHKDGRRKLPRKHNSNAFILANHKYEKFKY